MAFHYQHMWHPLVGQHVAIMLHGDVVRHGTVDAVTKDDGILWLNFDGAETRQLFERSEGFQAWIDYKWDSGRQADCRIYEVLALHKVSSSRRR